MQVGGLMRKSKGIILIGIILILLMSCCAGCSAREQKESITEEKIINYLYNETPFIQIIYYNIEELENLGKDTCLFKIEALTRDINGEIVYCCVLITEKENEFYRETIFSRNIETMSFKNTLESN